MAKDKFDLVVRKPNGDIETHQNLDRPDVGAKYNTAREGKHTPEDKKQMGKFLEGTDRKRVELDHGTIQPRE